MGRGHTVGWGGRVGGGGGLAAVGDSIRFGHLRGWCGPAWGIFGLQTSPCHTAVRLRCLRPRQWHGTAPVYSFASAVRLGRLRLRLARTHQVPRRTYTALYGFSIGGAPTASYARLRDAPRRPTESLRLCQRHGEAGARRGWGGSDSASGPSSRRTPPNPHELPHREWRPCRVASRTRLTGVTWRRAAMRRARPCDAVWVRVAAQREDGPMGAGGGGGTGALHRVRAAGVQLGAKAGQPCA